MIPLRDNIPSRTFPIVNYLMIGTCSLVFFAQLADGDNEIIEKYGMIPVRVMHPDQPVEIVVSAERVRTERGVEERYTRRPAAPAAVNPWLTLLTCVFLHGGWMHFLGNMWFLYIFGDNVEDRIGHVGYFLFYLGCGAAASATHLLTNLDSSVPTIGASGAIAGVMGAYFLLYRHAMVLTLIPIIIFQVVVLPAPLFLGVWFVMQLFSASSPAASGVAWWAHIGGFAVGFVGAWLLKQVHETSPPVVERLPNTDHVTAYRLRDRGRPNSW